MMQQIDTEQSETGVQGRFAGLKFFKKIRSRLLK